MSDRFRPLHIVHTECSGGWGGQELRILAEAQGLQERGHHLTLLCPENVPLFEAARQFGVRTIGLPINHKNLTGLGALRRWLRQNRADVINSHSSTDSWLAALSCLGRKDRPALVRTRHVSTPVSRKWSTRWLYQHATDCIVTTGEGVRASLINYNGYAPDKIVSVPTGIDPARFYPGDRQQRRNKLQLPLDRILIGVVATIRDWKGHYYLLESIAQLKDPRLHLLIIGDGPYRAAVEQHIRELDVGQQVTLTGHQRDVLPYLQALDVFVLPSYANEGVPQAIVQAMMCSLPVVATAVGCVEEAVIHQETGLLVQARNVKQLSDAIALLAASPDLRQEFGQDGRQHAQRRFVLSAMLDRMEQVFLGCVAQKQPVQDRARKFF